MPRAFHLRVTVLVGVIGASVLSACGGLGSGTNYTSYSLAHSSCDHPLSRIGDLVEPILNIRNTSGHDWKQTYVWINGNDNFRNDGVSLNNQQSTSEGAGIYALGPLAANSTGDIHVHLTAASTGAPKITFEPWGNSDASTDNVPDIPSDGLILTCRYAVR